MSTRLDILFRSLYLDSQAKELCITLTPNVQSCFSMIPAVNEICTSPPPLCKLQVPRNHPAPALTNAARGPVQLTSIKVQTLTSRRSRAASRRNPTITRTDICTTEALHERAPRARNPGPLRDCRWERSARPRQAVDVMQQGS